MLKKPLLLALFAIISFLAWRHFTSTPPPTPLTPEQEVNALLSLSVIPAKELAEICGKYPSLVTSAFKKERKMFSVSGKISKALPVGVNSDNLAIELEGIPNLKIMFHSDYYKILKWIQSKPDWTSCRRYKFHRESQTIVFFGYMDSLLPNGKKNRADSLNRVAPFTRVVCREGETLTLRGEFRHIGAGWIKCDLLELP
jgi:hypothetical protein